MIIICEGRQRGVLYHFTNESGFNGIIDNNGIKSYLHDFISFTRSFKPPKGSHVEYSNIRFAFDGDKLSNKFKIEPYSDYGYDEFEERIKWPSQKILPCMFALKRIDILNIAFEKEEMDEILKIKLPIFFVDKFKKV